MKNRLLLIVLLLFIGSIAAVISIKSIQDTRQHAAGGMPHVVGTHIVDGNAAPLLWYGAQLEGVLNGGGIAEYAAFPKIVSVMANDWHMNTIRLPSCNWFWKADPTGYMTKLQNVVQTANQAGLYVIIDLHDDHNCNPPYPWPGPYHLPRPEMDTYWQAVATTLKNNPMVIFDIYNEPNIPARPKHGYTDTDWKLWLHGGTVQDSNGTETFIGMQHLIDIIRQTGAQQILMVEGYTTAETFYNIGTNTVVDPLQNVVYEAHKYSLLDGAAAWDQDFGFMHTTYPVFVGEWALMGGDNSGNTNCGSVQSPALADQTVSTFLQYMASRNMGWTAYSFDPEHLIVDNTNFQPTVFSSTWVCPQRGTNTINHAGMGMDLKNYLASLTPAPTIHTSPSPRPSPNPTGTPTPTPSVAVTQQPTPTPTISQSLTPTPTIDPTHTIFSVTVCPHGIGSCGDNANPTGGTKNPRHPDRPVTITVFDLSNTPVGSPVTGVVSFVSSAGNFQGTVDMGTLVNGTYIVSIQMQGYLAAQVPGVSTVVAKQTTLVPAVSLVAGNIDNNQTLDLRDYNILIDCFDTKETQQSCTSHHIIQPEGADILDDDGQVDGADYNLLIREFSVQKGQ